MSAPAPNALQSAIHKLAFHEPLTGEDAERAFDVVMRGEATAVQIASLLSAMRAAGENPEGGAGGGGAPTSGVGGAPPPRSGHHFRHPRSWRGGAGETLPP